MSAKNPFSSLEHRCLVCLADATEDGRPAPITTPDYTQIQRLAGLSGFVAFLARSHGDLFSVARDRRGINRLRPLVKDVSTALREVVLESFEVLGEHFPQHRFNPKVEVFLDLLSSSEELRYYEHYYRHWQDVNIIHRLCELFNRFANDFRERVSTLEHVKQEKNQLRLVNSNIESARSFLSKMFALEPGALPVVLEFYCENKPHLSDKATVQFDCARKRRDLFIRMLRRKSKVLGVIGYMWRMEYSAFKGYAYTLVVLFRSDFLDQIPIVVGDLGRFWCNLDFVSGRFGYWNIAPHGYPLVSGEPPSGQYVDLQWRVEGFIVSLFRTDYDFRLSLEDHRYPIFKTGVGDLSYLEDIPALSIV